MSNKVYASYNGSQVGFTIREFDLTQDNFANTGIAYSSVAAGPDNDLFMTAGNHIYHYQTNGTPIKDMEFTGDPGVIYSSVTVKGNRVYATYRGSQHGVTVNLFKVGR